MWVMEEITRAAEYIAGSRYLVVFTGAGMSADSGIPVFRGGSGLWDRYSLEDLATPQGFQRNPELVWRWYLSRLEKVRRARPHKGYHVIRDWWRGGLVKTVITQNVDGLFRRVGIDDVIELHGSLHRFRCTRCWYRGEIDSLDLESLPPICPNCYSLLRPDVVWFGEPLDQAVWRRALTEVLRSDTLLVIGTSGVVYPAASLVEEAHANRARIVEVNPEPSALTGLSTIWIGMGAEKALVEIDRVLRRMI